MKYELYFFRESNKSIDASKIIDFFDSIEGMNIEIIGETVKIEYQNEATKNQAVFYFTPTLLVPNIYKLNPKYISLKFHMEMPIDLPNYNAEVLFKTVGIMAKTFDIYMYNQMFENVLPFRMELLMSSYTSVKKYYIEEYHDASKEEKYVIPTNKLYDVLRYQQDIKELERYYQDEKINVPKYVYLKDEDEKIYLACEWEEGMPTIFPPHIDIIFYKYDSMMKMIYAKEVLETLEPNDLPGFIQGTKIVDEKCAKRARRILKKVRFTMVTETFSSITLDKLVDL